MRGSRSPRPSDGRGARGEGNATPSTINSQPSTNSAHTARAAREKAEAELAELQSRLAPLEQEINQLTRQFWVTKDPVAAQNYDLSASRYPQVEQDDVFYERAEVTLDRLSQLERFAGHEVAALREMLNQP